jgi:F-type H+-transporting ATPase subunit delta
MADDRTTAYAEALAAVAKAEGSGAVVNELFEVAKAVRGSDELQDKLADPHLPVAMRLQVIDDLLAGKASAATVSLVSLVVANGRIRQFPAIVDEVMATVARQASKEVADVRSATALTDDQQSRLADALGKATGKQIEVRVTVDPSLQGGIIAQVGDTVIDGSVRRRLDQLKHAL